MQLIIWKTGGENAVFSRLILFSSIAADSSELSGAGIHVCFLSLL